MTEYINKAELMEQYPEFDGYTFADVTTIEIVTCGECKWLLKAKVGKGRCVMHFADVAEDYFCANGERKE